MLQTFVNVSETSRVYGLRLRASLSDCVHDAQVSEGGFYDREKLFWRRVRDTVVAVAAAPPGGARSAPSARFSRLFSVLCLPTQCTASNTAIFG